MTKRYASSYRGTNSILQVLKLRETNGHSVGVKKDRVDSKHVTDEGTRENTRMNLRILLWLTLNVNRFKWKQISRAAAFEWLTNIEEQQREKITDKIISKLCV
jgi:hypothetical protein